MTDHDAAGGKETPASATESTGRDGQRFVLVLYVALIGVGAAAGLLTGTFVSGL